MFPRLLLSTGRYSRLSLVALASVRLASVSLLSRQLLQPQRRPTPAISGPALIPLLRLGRSIHVSCAARRAGPPTDPAIDLTGGPRARVSARRLGSGAAPAAAPRRARPGVHSAAGGGRGAEQTGHLLTESGLISVGGWELESRQK